MKKTTTTQTKRYSVHIDGRLHDEFDNKETALKSARELIGENPNAAVTIEEWTLTEEHQLN